MFDLPICSEIKEECGSFRKIAVLKCKEMRPPIQGIVDCGYCVEPGKGVFTVKIVCSPLQCCIKKVKTPLAPEAELFKLIMKLGREIAPHLAKDDLKDLIELLPEEKVDELALIDLIARYFPWIFRVQLRAQ